MQCKYLTRDPRERVFWPPLKVMTHRLRTSVIDFSLLVLIWVPNTFCVWISTFFSSRFGECSAKVSVNKLFLSLGVISTFSSAQWVVSSVLLNPFQRYWDSNSAHQYWNPTVLLSPVFTCLRAGWTSLSTSEICSPWFLGDPFHGVGWFYLMIFFSFLEFVCPDSLVSLNSLSELSSMISNFSSRVSSSSVESSLSRSWFDFTHISLSSLDGHQSFLTVALWPRLLRAS